jgi:hypothetical protein
LPYPFELIKEIRVSIVLSVSEFIFPNILQCAASIYKSNPC